MLKDKNICEKMQAKCKKCEEMVLFSEIKQHVCFLEGQGENFGASLAALLTAQTKELTPKQRA